MENLVTNKNIRNTKVRRHMLRLFSTTNAPMSAIDIQAHLLRNDLSVNKTTIYRELSFLKSLNLIRDIEFGDGKKRYERTDSKHHHHLICIKCDMIKDVEIDFDLSKNLDKLEKESKFKIMKHSLELFGVCKKCQF